MRSISRSAAIVLVIASLLVPLACWSAQPANHSEPAGLITVKLVATVAPKRHLVSFVSLAAPKEPKQHYNQAYRAWREGNGNLSKAVEHLERAIALYPEFADAWHFVGAIRFALHQLEPARSAFLRALEADPRYLDPCLPLALVDLEIGHFDEAANIAQRVLRQNPGLVEARYYHAIASYLMGSIELAGQSARDVIARGGGQKYPRAFALLASAHAARGDFRTAAAEYERYLRLEPSSAMAEIVRGHLAEWQASGRMAASTRDLPPSPRAR